jgi:hypothetical protein
MSGIVSGVSKVFSTVGQAAARVGSAVTGVGASVFSAGAATGAGAMASGGLNGVVQSVAGKGVLSNVLSGAIKTALPGMVIGGAVGAMTGTGFMKGALMGGLGGAAMGGFNAYSAGMQPGVDGMTTGSTGGLGSAAGGSRPSQTGDNRAASSPTFGPGVDPTTGQAVTTASTGATVPGTTRAGDLAQEGQKGGLGAFLNSDTFNSVIGGVGQGMIEKAKVDAIAAENQKNRDFQKANQQRITDSYDVSSSSLNRGRFVYDPAQGRIVSTG